ncbi:MAG TPA: class I SAM-dependent methyltransferase [Gemmatales bacterium]|nr:class I SAM-dependent methyltransferase [Gemmatales bacterium]
MSTGAQYDTIGQGYSKTRREEPSFRERIHAALGSARTVVNVGAGAGSYEPRDRYVVAIEPSDVMAAQRSSGLVPAIRAGAGDLPLRDKSVDAAMAVLSLHHWDDWKKGLSELRRVARGPVVLLTYDVEVCVRMWLLADYAPEIAELDRRIFPDPKQLGHWLGGQLTIEVVPIPRNCADWMVGSFWAHPERVLDPTARAGTSAFARLSPDVVERIVSEVSRDLKSGTWDARYGHLRKLDFFDAGLRLVIATCADGPSNSSVA